MVLRQTILIVDDNPKNLVVLGELLHERYKVRTANSGRRALQLAIEWPAPDLILLEVMLPGMNGYEVLEKLRQSPDTRDIPVIFTTAMAAAEDEDLGLVMGAVDYITKPLRPAIVLARVRTHLELKRARDRLRLYDESLVSEIAEQAHENMVIQEITIRSLSRLAGTRDNETGDHSLRTQAYLGALARRMSTHPRHGEKLSERSISLITRSARLHDIGNVGIPDSILLKPGKLTPSEWEVVKSHTRLGAEALSRAETDVPEPVDFLRYAKELALHHHERWDGSGYPDGLAGDAIPLAARLMAVADVFDALTSPRVYKKALTFEDARDLMIDQRGKHFDPDIVNAFSACFDEFCDIAERHLDVVRSGTKCGGRATAPVLAGPTPDRTETKCGSPDDHSWGYAGRHPVRQPPRQLPGDPASAIGQPRSG